MNKFKLLNLLLFVFPLCACQSIKNSNEGAEKYISFSFEQINNTSEIEGSILIYDLNKGSYYSNNFKWAEIGQMPASTFKIPHSLIALELGIVKDEKALFIWNGEKRDYKIWQQDLTFKQAFTYSCVPCYQEIANKVDVKRMNNFINKFNYGNMEIYSDNIDEFWLIGESKISQFQQIDFLKRLYHSQLPISKRSEQIFKKIFVSKQTDEYILRSKTGLSNNKGRYNGWYVGYLEQKGNVYFFATNISPKVKYQKSFNAMRKNITLKVLEQIAAFKQ